MSCVRHAFPLVLATAMAVTGFAAEPGSSAVVSAKTAADVASASASTSTSTPATNEVDNAARPDRPRAISPTTAAQLAMAAPKFEPPASTSADANQVPADQSVDLREIDRPRNTIIRLPNYMVREEKPVVLTEREVQTPQARLHLALKKHPGLRLGSFWIFRNDGIALAMLAEEERLEQKQYFEDLVRLTSFSDPATKATAKQSVSDTFMRTSDFGR